MQLFFINKMYKNTYYKILKKSLIPFLVSICIKLLLFESYRSTDFEVHRNWLAITGTLSPSKWYYENTSIGTLDYPPFFAWFQYCLANLCKLFGIQDALLLSPTPVFSQSILYFQRASVVLSDVLLLVGLVCWCSAIESKVDKSGGIIARSSDQHQEDDQQHHSLTSSFFPQFSFLSIEQLSWLVLLNPSLLLLDHIHFQYNGMLIGLLLIVFSLYRRGQTLLGTLAFAVLCYTKHTFFTFAAPFIVHTFAHYILRPASATRYTLLSRLLSVLLPCLLLTAIAFLPFLLPSFPPDLWQHVKDNLSQITTRLFPFGRGLTHAYWAPNLWALYLFADKILHTLLCSHAFARSLLSRVHPMPKIDAVFGSSMCKTASASAPVTASIAAAASVTATDGRTDMHGVVEVLPEITPSIAFTFVVCMLVPVLWKLWILSPSSPNGKKDKKNTITPSPDCDTTSSLHTRTHHNTHASSSPPPLVTRPEVLYVHLFSLYSALVFFAFGWHIHEKASLYILLPLLVLSADPELNTSLNAILHATHVTHATHRAWESMKVFQLPHLIPRLVQHLVQCVLSLFPPCTPPLFAFYCLLWVPCHVSYLPLIYTPLEQPFIFFSFLAYVYLLYALIHPSRSQRPLNLSHQVRDAKGMLRQNTPVTGTGRVFHALRYLISIGIGSYAVVLGVVAVLQVPGIRQYVFQKLPFLPLILVSTTVSVSVLMSTLVLGCVLSLLL